MLIRMKEVSDAHNGASVIAVLPVAREEVDRFGVIAGCEVEEAFGKSTSLVESDPVDEAPSNLAVFGRYLLTPRVMDLLAESQAWSRW